MKVSEQLAKARKDKGMTVRQVGASLGCSAMTISYSENGNLKRRMVGYNAIRAIATLYGLDADAIVKQYQEEQAELKRVKA